MKTKPGYIKLNGREIEASQIARITRIGHRIQIVVSDGPRQILEYDSPADCRRAEQILNEEVNQARESIGLPPIPSARDWRNFPVPKLAITASLWN